MSGMGGTIMPGGYTFIPRHQCPGGQSCLGMNVRGDTFSRGTAMPPTLSTSLSIDEHPHPM